jgi:hypothetical protein
MNSNRANVFVYFINILLFSENKISRYLLVYCKNDFIPCEADLRLYMTVMFLQK